jgi:signal transduction histidine kinase
MHMRAWAGLLGLILAMAVWLLPEAVRSRYTLIGPPSVVHIKTTADADGRSLDVRGGGLLAVLPHTSHAWQYQYEFWVPAGHQAFLITQLVNGARIQANGVSYDYVPHTDAQTRYLWLRPHLSYIPTGLMTPGAPTRITVESAGWGDRMFLAPMYSGDIKSLNQLAGVIQLVSSTLAVASSLLSLMVAALLFLVWRIRKSDKIHLYGGLAAVFWAGVFLLGSVSIVPQSWVPWHRVTLCLLAAGWLLSLSHMVLAYLGWRLRRYQVWLLRVPPAVVLVVGVLSYGRTASPPGEMQQSLAYAVSACLLVLAIVVLHSLRKHRSSTRVVMAAALLLAALGVFHDARLLSFEFLSTVTRQATAWDLLQTPVLLSAVLVPPLFVFPALRLLREHRRNLADVRQYNADLQTSLDKLTLELKIAHLVDLQVKRKEAIDLERTAIYRDLHDGIGARLVATVYGLKNGRLSQSKLEDSLLSCLRDIRKIMFNESMQDQRCIQEVFFEYCLEMDDILASTAIQLRYAVPPDRELVLLGERTAEIMKMVRELLTNAIKHSQAAKLSLVLKVTDDLLLVEFIESDFVRADASFARQYLPGQSSHIGLDNIQTRARDIGAVFIQSVSEDSRLSVLSMRLFVDRGWPLPGAQPVNREERRMFLSTKISELT